MIGEERSGFSRRALIQKPIQEFILDRTE